MVHFAFIAPPLAGHCNPMTALAVELIGRGHRATFIHQADARGLVGDPRIGFHAVGAATHPPGTLAAANARLGRLSGWFSLGRLVRDVARTTDMLCREAPRVLRDIGADGVVADQLEAAGGLVAAHLGLPHVSVANALMINREPNIPPPFVGWRYRASRTARHRNRGGYRVHDLLMRSVSRTIAAHAKAWGLPMRTVEDWLSPLAQISQTVAGFDFPRRELPAFFHYVGPLRAPLDPPAAFPVVTKQKLVFASLGSLQGGRVGVFRVIAEACSDLGVKLLIAHGGRLQTEELAGLPGAPLVFDFVPQRLVLRQAAAAVCHGGLNTVLDGLACATPAIAIPLAFEQAANAARLDRCGAGLSLPRSRLTRTSLRSKLEALLSDDRYRRRSAELQGEIARAGGCGLAASIVEQAVRSGRPVSRSEGDGFRHAHRSA